MPPAEDREQPATLAEALALLGIEEQEFRDFLRDWNQKGPAPQKGWERFLCELIHTDLAEYLSKIQAGHRRTTMIGLCGAALAPKEMRRDGLLYPERYRSISETLKQATVSAEGVLRIQNAVGAELGTLKVRPSAYVLGPLLELSAEDLKGRLAVEGESEVLTGLIRAVSKRIESLETLN